MRCSEGECPSNTCGEASSEGSATPCEEESVSMTCAWNVDQFSTNLKGMMHTEL